MKYSPNDFSKFLAASMATTAVVAAPVAGSTFAADVSFTDVDDSAYYAEAIEALVERGVLKGYPDGTFKPGDSVTRAEAAVMLADLLEFDTSQNSAATSFSDVKDGVWYTGAISALVDAEIVNGFPDGTFRPGDTVTRAEIAKMIVLAYPELEEGGDASRTFTDVRADVWYSEFIAPLVDHEITTGTTTTTFSPGDDVTRGQAATFLHRAEQVESPVQTIESISNEEIVLDGVSYQVASDVQALLNGDNQDALAGANVRVETSGQEVTSVTYLETNAGGTESDILVLDGGDYTVNGDVVINGDHVSVTNLAVAGDLEIYSETSFAADGLTVEGNTIVSEKILTTQQVSILNSTNANVTFANSSLGKVEVKKNGVRVNATGSTSIREVSMQTSASISAEEGQTIESVSVEGDAEDVEINAAVTSLVLNSTKEVKLTGKGNIESVAINGSEKITIDRDGEIKKVTVPKDSKVEDIIQNFDDIKDRIAEVEESEDSTEDSEGTEDESEDNSDSGSDGAGGAGGGEGNTNNDSTPEVTNLDINNINFTKSGNTFRAEVDANTSVQRITGDFNVPVKVEIKEIQNQNGANRLGLLTDDSNSVETSVELDSGEQTLDLFELFLPGVDDLSSLDAGALATLINFGADIEGDTKSFAIVIELTNSNNTSKKTTYNVEITVVN
ncbi:S-layer homology domain-containing protein [Desertibacillus haloalkaliphilus]|uniref:S-layer homology domain-containing protein n=1 Tax=Desertibacillus haloalkaliphilus TaxID=1328930 RepID=UPI001C281446|nr:S-layer homology domain-containing protein [Desertibacillus haloalkaliphilus]MBU8906493.1 S-layer homology domain-containing protein [Desertibacillus haloalkaliphilus]